MNEYDYFHHPFDPSLEVRDEAGCCMCSVCECPWDDEKHYDWQGNKIPMKNANVVIVTEGGSVRHIKGKQ